MGILNALLATLAGVVAGAIIGVVFGFSLASHSDVLRGVRPNTTSRLILFLARPTRELNLFEIVVFVLVMLLWVVVLFGLILFPAIAAQRLAGDGMPLAPVAYASFAIAAWFGWRFSARARRSISQQ